MKVFFSVFFCAQLILASAALAAPEHSVARQWNEVLLEAIRHDFARPTVHARNLFHTSVALYDAWAVYNNHSPFLLGQNAGGTETDFSGVAIPADRFAASCEAMSYAAYRLLSHRFAAAPRLVQLEGGEYKVAKLFDLLMESLGYDPAFSSVDYGSGSPAALGNYIGRSLIEFGLQDRSNEAGGYANEYYQPINLPLDPGGRGNPDLLDPNFWQSLEFELFIDQSGNAIPGETPSFIGAEWGKVIPFALSTDHLRVYKAYRGLRENDPGLSFYDRPRIEHEWWVYYDPGPPPRLQSGSQSKQLFNEIWKRIFIRAVAYQEADRRSDRLEENIPYGRSLSEEEINIVNKIVAEDMARRDRSGVHARAYQWGFALVSAWSAHLDPRDGVLWDISPARMGNVPALPQSVDEYPSFYNFLAGGDTGRGHALNPYTGKPYAPQIVPRGDYTRVLAEFWADGPDSETPPGHWFVILNHVNDHPLLEKRFKGEGPVLNALEWDVKSYFILGGAMHDAAIAAWGIKGWYDYIRPISALRFMATRGQSSDSAMSNYNVAGLPLAEDLIEVIDADDPLAGSDGENVGRIKLYAWRGPAYIDDPATSQAGVGWILAERWWPYQRPTFVTPPFAGYVSGHSTYSRAAAEVLRLLSGDAYFPGGLAEFPAKKNEFLVFEAGPSQDFTLQWATYRDAADQCSLSRIWGGIHPPADDIPGRLIGHQIGVNAFAQAEQYFPAQVTTLVEERAAAQPRSFALGQNYPNPCNSNTLISFALPRPQEVSLQVYNLAGQALVTLASGPHEAGVYVLPWDGCDAMGRVLASGLYLYRLQSAQFSATRKLLLIR